MKKVLIAAVLAVFVAPAMADSTHICQTPGSCSGGGGESGANATATATGVGIGVAGATANNQVTVGVDNRLHNTQGQFQSAEGGTASSIVAGSGNSHNVNTAVAAGGMGGQGGSATGGNVGDITVTVAAPEDNGATGRSNDPIVTQNINQTEETVHYSGGYDVRNVPEVNAPSLTTATETCMGSSSVGGSGVGFGFSFGTTWRDAACVRRLDARQLQSLGYPLGAKELMCDSGAVRAALKRAGRPCYEDLPDAQKRPEDRKKD